MTYYIPEGNVKQFETRIARLIKRALKLGSPLSYVINRDDFRDEKAKFTGNDGKETEVFVRRFRVEVTGEEPKYAGWQFIGTLEHTDEGNVLRMVPGKIAPPQYRDCAPFCEHCKLKRVRKDTFLVHHVENGTTTQVGSNCLVDFLGHENPQSLAQLAAILGQPQRTHPTRRRCPLARGGGGGAYINKDRQDLLTFPLHRRGDRHPGESVLEPQRRAAHTGEASAQLPRAGSDCLEGCPLHAPDP
jgi:hypothetical protein